MHDVGGDWSPVEHRDGTTASQRVYDAIYAAILDGQYRPGMRLVEAELSVGMGVSRTPIREAIRRLDAEGLVVTSPHRSATIANWSAEALVETYRIRALLEGEASERAATRLSEAQIDVLDDLAVGMQRVVAERPAGFLQTVGRMNTEFHGLIVEGADNGLLATLVRLALHRPLVYRTFTMYSDAEFERSLFQHREIVLAFRERDPGVAALLMRAHLLAACTAAGRVFRTASALEALGDAQVSASPGPRSRRRT